MAYLYMHPEEFGVEVVAEFDAYEPDYSFDLVYVVKEIATGKFYAACDSGCSCPVPFEDFTFPTDWTEVRSWKDVKAIMDNEFPVQHYSRHRCPHDSFRRQVQNALGA